MDIAKSSNIPANFKDSDKSEEYIKALDGDVRNLFACLQGRTRFGSGTDGSKGENVSGQFQVVSDTGSADTEFTVSHDLGAVPIGLILIKSNKAGIVYSGSTSWTSSAVYLKCSVANANVTIFLLK